MMFYKSTTMAGFMQPASMLQKAATLTQIQSMDFSRFRKKLGLYSFKLSKNKLYKNPHAMPLHLRQQYEKQGYRGELKIRDIERNSDRPFGKVSNKGRFQFNIEKVPFFNIPDLTGFKVRI